MFQKFYEDTLIGRFIKRLIRSTNLPILSIIQHNDYVIQDCYYIHNGYIVHALTSGRFCIDPDRHFGTGTSVTNEASTDSDNSIASYEVVDKYDEENKQHSYNFHSRFMYYDPETHYHLGEYLRYIQDTTGLNLFPYYNCFSGKSIDEIFFDTDTIEKDGTPTVLNIINTLPSSINHKVLLSPVKYGKTYTIALECGTPVTIQPIIYNSNTGLVIKDYKVALEPEYYSDDFNERRKTYPSSSFLNPFTFTVPDALNKQSYQQERNLYLAIQVPVDLPSGLVVLEGDYTHCWYRSPHTKVVKSFDSSTASYGDTFNELYTQNPALLHFDSKSNIAFSDRLVEYLLLGVINDNETLDGNIKYLQEELKKITDNTFYNISGVWDARMRQRLYSFTNKENRQYLLRDLDGYFNKDLERILSTYSKEN